jgi:NADH dehydrogenase FAD-containing subunit/acetyl-CoA acetyltransferase
MDIGAHEVDFLAQSHWHHFRYRIGEMIGLDRERREVQVAAFLDEDGRQVTPLRSFRYDTLVFAIGSQSNDFGTPGVIEHGLRLESVADARRFHRRLVDACIRAHAQPGALQSHQLQVAIIGAGATGVELAAELHRTTREVVAYGLDRIDPDKDIRVNLIEAAERVLPALPPRLSTTTEGLLRKLGVHVHTAARVAEVLPDGVRLADGRVIAAELVVWAAGVKAPDFLKEIAGLETNRINQLVVRPTLQTTLDDDIFALGDCASCAWPEAPGGNGGFVPPRAQAAHQQATHILGQIKRRLSMDDVVIVNRRPYRGRQIRWRSAKTAASDLGRACDQGPAGQDRHRSPNRSAKFLGQVLTAGVGQNPARQAVIKRRLPNMVPAMTINKVCGSGLKATHLAAQAIKCGDADIVIAGGQENMSASPHVLPGSRDGFRMGDAKLVDTMIVDGLWDVYNQYHMGTTAENVAKKFEISRAEQDEFALASQNKAKRRRKPASSRTRSCRWKSRPKRAARVFDTDEFQARHDARSARRAAPRLRQGRHGDRRQCLGHQRRRGRGDHDVGQQGARTGLPVLARIKAYASAGLDPAIMGMGPVPASQLCLKKAGWTTQDLDLMEINEAFAAQACAVNKRDGLGHQRRSTSMAARSPSAIRSALRAPHPGHADARNDPARRQARPGLALHRRRHGRGAGDRALTFPQKHGMRRSEMTQATTARRVVLVTGGMGGLGETISTKMADAGYKVAVTYSPGNTKHGEWVEEMKARGYRHVRRAVRRGGL